MKIWILKAVVQKTISLLPFKNKINFLFQKHITKGLTLTDDLFCDKLYHCNRHVQVFQQYSGKKDFTSLEIGTGWYPIVPVGLYLCGAGDIHSVDITPLTNRNFFIATLRKFIEYHNSGKLTQLLPQYSAERMKTIIALADSEQDLEAMYKQLRFNFTVQDARHTNFKEGYFDLINSNNTFEHIYPEILEPILVEFKRILASDGIMSHNIDLSDHFAHLDKSITPYNFLQFSDQQWNRIDNSIQPQNRLRVNDYSDMLKRTGFAIIANASHKGDEALLNQVKLDEKYRNYNPQDILVTQVEFVAKKQ